MWDQTYMLNFWDIKDYLLNEWQKNGYEPVIYLMFKYGLLFDL